MQDQDGSGRTSATAVDDMTHDGRPGDPVPPAGVASPRVSAEDQAEEVRHSLTEDIESTIADGRTYLQAELAYQKSRAGYAGSQGVGAAINGVAALLFVHLALIALTVGLLIGFSTLFGPWIATAIMTVVLLIGAAIFGLRARSRARNAASVFGGDEEAGE
jgi:uncharacterized membrane protein YqjE